MKRFFLKMWSFQTLSVLQVFDLPSGGPNGWTESPDHVFKPSKICIQVSKIGFPGNAKWQGGESDVHTPPVGCLQQTEPIYFDMLWKKTKQKTHNFKIESNFYRDAWENICCSLYLPSPTARNSGLTLLSIKFKSRTKNVWLWFFDKIKYIICI